MVHDISSTATSDFRSMPSFAIDSIDRICNYCFLENPDSPKPGLIQKIQERFASDVRLSVRSILQPVSCQAQNQHTIAASGQVGQNTVNHMCVRTVPEKVYDSRSLLVNLSHQAYLPGILDRVVLIDADGIYPPYPTSSRTASIVQGIQRVLCSSEPAFID